MKLSGLLSVAVAFSVLDNCHSQSPIEGFGEAIANPVGALNHQITLVQKVLSELSRTVTGLANTGTRSSADALTSSLTSVLNQLSSLQNSLNNVASQAQRVLDSGSRVITGQPRASPQLDVESAPIVREGKSGPAEVLVRTVDSAAKQLSQLTQVVEHLSQNMGQILADGARSLEFNDLNPTSTVLDALEESVKQISQAQQSFRNINNQMNDMLETGTRSMFGNGKSEVTRQKRSENDVVTGMQQIASDLTTDFGKIGGTLARIAAGVSGVRIPGLTTDGKGNLDTQSAAYQALNPVGVIRRGFNNFASSIARVVPGRK